MMPAACFGKRHLVSADNNLVSARVTRHPAHLDRFKPNGSQQYLEETK